MEWHDLLIDGYSRVLDTMEEVLKGLRIDDLDWQPRQDCNSIGWECWHLSRGQDSQIASLMGEEQLWIKDKWYLKFHRDEDPEDTGFGHTPEQVAAFKSPSAEVQIAYQKAILERCRKFFPTLNAKDLDRKLDEPWFNPLPTVGVRLISIMADGIIHAGQASYVRGLRQGKGWLSY